MGILSRIFGTEKAIDTALDVGKKVAFGLMDGVDHLKFTSEEQAEHNLKSSGVVLGFWDRFAKENTIQSRTRRALAIGSFQVYFFLILVSVVVYRFDEDLSMYILQIVKYLAWLMPMIAAASFVPYQICKHTKWGK